MSSTTMVVRKESAFGLVRDTFAARVYAVLERIPYGKVAAYGQIAGLCAMPRNARQVGHLLADGLAHGTDAPWHRVINSAGRISLPHDSGGALQRRLLESEGVTFNKRHGIYKRLSRSEPLFTWAARSSTSSRGL